MSAALDLLDARIRRAQRDALKCEQTWGHMSQWAISARLTVAKLEAEKQKAMDEAKIAEAAR